ncbi:hypothetical protein AWB78_03885 [Caballeronia calidae]|uniref:Uncharacterized protein n=1 Tax=Caballeronia calidae TaxID=1777139 RepID=A0A158CFM1_9BURK|nr:hypothetical protein [Caballeronia calidae]SAK81082.1 hypothetical protein AWB78_03885 [Caballeronia calidae]
MQINSAGTTAYTSADAPLPRRPASADVAQDAHDDSTETLPTADPSPVKSFTYGALGLERPEVQATDTGGFYTAGKWVAAAVTIGGIVSLFV